MTAKPRRTRKTPGKRTAAARDIEKSYGHAQFAAKLRRLAAAVETGRQFVIQVAGERIRVPAHAIFNVEHEQAGGDEEVEFQIKWRNR